MTLEELAIKYGTDKQCKVGHGYTTYYEKYFEPIRFNNINLLELGVREGWSMYLWNEYFPNANIYGLDNNLEGLCPTHFNSSRIHFKICSQTDSDVIIKWLNDIDEFDIIIDDASHISKLSIESFNILFPLLKIGGLYIIEDLHVSSLPIYNPNNFSTHQFLDELKNRKDLEIYEYLNRKICFVRKI